MKTYRVQVLVTISTAYTGYVEIEAGSESEAKEELWEVIQSETDLTDRFRESRSVDSIAVTRISRVE